MPVPTNRANFKVRQRRGPDPDQANRDPHDQKGHHRVHRDAELAMIGVTPNRVHMGYLGNGQIRQQNEAHYRRRLRSPRPRAAINSKACANRGQPNILTRHSTQIYCIVSI